MEAFSSNTSSNSVAPTSMGLLHFEFIGVSKCSRFHPQFRNDGFSQKVRVIFSIVDSESGISFHLCEIFKNFTSSEGKALQVLADLHGGGDKSNELVVP
jgi:hypothetical protein